MSDQNDTFERFPAMVLTDTRALPKLKTDGTDLDLSDRAAALEVIRSHATDPSIFDDRAPFIWAARISNSRKDYYSTIMDPATTLRNYYEDLISGVAFLDSHQQNHQPVGRSFAAAIVETDDVTDVYGAFYTIPDLESSRINTTHLIDSIRAGLTSDVSVGFKRGENFMMRCSICGGDMNSWEECSHFSGMRYETYDENTGEWKSRVAVGIIIDARLSEVSGVYDGATPTCMIEKAQFLAERGLIKDNQLLALERHLRTTLPAKPLIVGQPIRQADPKPDADASNSNQKGDRTMSDDNKAKEGIVVAHLDKFVRKITELGISTGEQSDDTLGEHADRVIAEIMRLRTCEAQLTEYRDAEIADALAEGVRAQGDKFDNARWTKMLASASISDIRSFRKEWQAAGDAILANDGRRSTEDGDNVDDSKNAESDDKRVVPDDLLLPVDLFMTR